MISSVLIVDIMLVVVVIVVKLCLDVKFDSKLCIAIVWLCCLSMTFYHIYFWGC